MGKTIDISKINLSAKGLGMLLVGIAILIVIYKLAEWGISKIGGSTATSGFTGKVI